MTPGKPFFRRSAASAGLILVALLTALAWRLPPVGGESALVAQFLGRFHPILVHLPIGLLVLVPVLELAGVFGRRDDLRASAGFVLNLATAGAIVAALDGWLLARHGGYAGTLVIHHMWWGVILSALCLLTAGVRGRPGFAPLYGPLLLATVALMGWTSHQGGELTHGQGFLTDRMPGILRSWLHLPAPAKPAPAATGPAAGEPTLYLARIAPIFDRSCVSCHGPKKVKGEFRLDTYAALMSGGENGAEVVPWHPARSELVRRLTLPPDDDDFMPNNGKNLLTPDEVNRIELWIAAGASATQPLVAEGPAARQ